MYLLIVKDGLLTRYIGPYLTTSLAADDLQRVLSSCSNRANWQIHAIETPRSRATFVDTNQCLEEDFPKAS